MITLGFGGWSQVSGKCNWSLIWRYYFKFHEHFRMLPEVKNIISIIPEDHKSEWIYCFYVFYLIFSIESRRERKREKHWFVPPAWPLPPPGNPQRKPSLCLSRNQTGSLSVHGTMLNQRHTPVVTFFSFNKKYHIKIKYTQSYPICLKTKFENIHRWTSWHFLHCLHVCSQYTLWSYGVKSYWMFTTCARPWIQCFTCIIISR